MDVYKKIKHLNEIEEEGFDNNSSELVDLECFNFDETISENGQQLSPLPSPLSTSKSVSTTSLSAQKKRKSNGDIDQLPPSKKTRAELFIDQIEKSNLEKEKISGKRHEERIKLTGMAVKYLGDISNTMKM